MKKNPFLLLAVLFLCLCLSSGLLTGCGADNCGLDPDKPVTLTMWHNFGGIMQQSMDELIDEFNSTVGKEKGIIINVTAISSSSELRKQYDMILNGDPGSAAMPDLLTCYPKTAVQFHEKGMIADLDEYFTKDELSAYVPQFLEEGRLPDGGLYVFPFAKSTEILYVNQTLFDRFAKETGATIDSLHTFEGIADAARKYYQWTDAKTPAIPDDGKSFFAADSWLNLAQAGMRQQGGSLFEDEKLSLASPDFQRIWDIIWPPAVEGGFAVYDGYSSDLSKTGDLVCSTGSSAGILFYGDTITYADNTVEQVEYNILPFPVFQGAQKIAIQRGNGFSVAKSDKTHEYAGAVFLKWFTQPEPNMRFIASTGYMPVTNTAFTEGMQKEIQQVKDPRIQKMLTAVTKMHSEYQFFVAPVFDDFDNLGKAFETSLKEQLRKDRADWLRDKNADLQKKAAEGLEAFAAHQPDSF